MKNKKLFLITDMEGVSGAVYGAYGLPPSGESKRSELLMTLEVNACIEGAREKGIQDFIVYEAHPFNQSRILSGLTIVRDYEQLPTCNLVAFLGQHCRAGVSDGVLSHTGSSRSILSLRVNGVEFGEFGLGAALAGDYNIPTIFLSGDYAATLEATALIPDIETIAVSKGFGNHSALCLAPQKAQMCIREGIQKALANSHTIQPLKVQGPVTFEITMKYPAQAERMCLVPGVFQKDSRTIFFQGPTFAKAYQIFTAICLPLVWWDSRGL
ncbi:MAG: M55 family metallopeptidase [Candidatus Ratteibacteria bacterium]|jgi:D-amino peptidase